MVSIIERCYREGFFALESEFYDEHHNEELKEAWRDIDCDKKRLKKLLMSGEALSEEKAKEVIEEIDRDYDRRYDAYSFDEFFCGWKIGARVIFESLIG